MSIKSSRALRLVVLAVTMAGASLAQARDPDIGVSVSVSQPGFYGRVDIGNTPPPVIYQQPIIIAPTPVAVQQRPIYLRVPPGHEKHWDKHCFKYRACGQPVYFVREVVREDHRHDDRDDHDDDHGKHHDHGRGHGKGHRH